MPGKPPGPMVLGVIRVLEQHKELTRAEICMLLGVRREVGASVVSRMSKWHKTVGKRIYITNWVDDDSTCSRRYLKAVYALGRAPNRPKPAPKSPAEASRDWRAKEKTRVNSVWAWGRSRQERAATRRGDV